MANTTSGTVTFDKTFAVEEIIEEAYERLGIQVSSGYQLKTARRSLNILFQEWGNRGIHYWEVGEANIDLIEGQAEYNFFRATSDGTSATTVPADTYGVADILEASLRSNRTQTTQSDSPMTKVDRSTYAGYGDKKTKSTPSNFWVQRFIDKITLTIYPTASSSAAGANNKLKLFYTKRIEDAGIFTNATDVPYRFVPCMTAGLSFYLSQKFAPQRSQEMKLYYEDELARALKEDGSASSTFVTPKTYYPAIT